MIGNSTATYSVQRMHHRKIYINARGSLLLVAVLTAVNLAILISGADTYFPFSAFVPYYIVMVGMLLCGKFPEEYYEGELEGINVFDDSVFYFTVAIAAVCILFYILSWIFSSKNRIGWIYAALFIYLADSSVMLYTYWPDVTIYIDLIFHAIIIIILLMGIRSHYKLMKLPPESAFSFEVELPSSAENAKTEGEEPSAAAKSSRVLRVADMQAKSRILASATVYNYEIYYRRVSTTNELVVNGNVYDEFVGTVEPAHTLRAYVDGHFITASFNGLITSTITVDDEIVAKKKRFY